jgi:hypothetical protein
MNVADASVRAAAQRSRRHILAGRPPRPQERVAKCDCGLDRFWDEDERRPFSARRDLTENIPPGRGDDGSQEGRGRCKPSVDFYGYWQRNQLA